MCGCARGSGAFRFRLADVRVTAFVVAGTALGRLGVGLRSVGVMPL